MGKASQEDGTATEEAQGTITFVILWKGKEIRVNGEGVVGGEIRQGSGGSE